MGKTAISLAAISQHAALFLGLVMLAAGLAGCFATVAHSPLQEQDPRLTLLRDSQKMMFVWAADPIDAQEKFTKALRLSKEDTWQPLVRVAPRYPIHLAEKGIGGKVVLEVLIDTRGNVVLLGVKESAPPRGFDAVVIDAVRHWKYKPYIVNGRPVDILVPLVMTFQVEGPLPNYGSTILKKISKSSSKAKRSVRALVSPSTCARPSSIRASSVTMLAASSFQFFRDMVMVASTSSSRLPLT